MLHNGTHESQAPPSHCAGRAFAEGRECLDAALRLARLGWPVVPLHEVRGDGSCSCGSTDPTHKAGKHPRVGKQWQMKATTDEAVIRSWFGKWPAANLGVACRPGGVFILGPDGEQGMKDLARLEAENGPLPPCPRQASGTPPGQHLVFRWAEGTHVKNRQTKKGEVVAHRGCCIDVRGAGGQFVVAPSRNRAGPYSWIVTPWEVPPPDPPGWLLRWLEDEEPSRGSAKGTTGPVLKVRAEPTVEERAVKYLASCPEAVSGQGGHAATMWAARAVVYGFDLGEDRGFAVLDQHYNPRCRPPWTEKELRHKCKDANKDDGFRERRGWLLKEDKPHEHNGHARHEHDGPAEPERPAPGGAGAPPGREPVNLTDLGNARRLARAAGDDLRWVRSWKKWIEWDGKRWSDGDQYDVRRRGESVITDLFLAATEQMKQLAGDDGDQAKVRLAALQKTQTWAKKSEDARRLNAMVDLLRSQPGVGIDHEQLDRDPWLLNCPNGTLDLRTGRLRPHARGDYLTRLCPTPFDPEAECPAWEAFLCDVFRSGDGPDLDLICYVQRLLGYGLTGDTSEHLLAVLHGTGANGKSVFVNVVGEVIGHEMVCTAAPDLLLARDLDKHPCELACLFGKRLVVCQEAGTGRRLNEPLVKWLTGGDRLQARRMREDPWEFTPTHKAILVSNYKPAVAGTDNGIWRRLRLIPFDVTFPPERQDKGLTRRLTAEAPGILAWMARGCSHWRAGGLNEPARVLAATRSYREGEDMVGRFIAERCLVSPDATVRSDALYTAFVAWSKAGGEEKVLSRRKFGEAMTGREGVGRETSNGTRYRGLALRDTPANAEQQGG
jgi:P4 family phage/plasmid primase-like protien